MKNAKSCVINGGKTTPHFKLEEELDKETQFWHTTLL